MRGRSLLAVVGMLLVSMVFTAGVRSSRVNAQDGATLTAAVVSGSCDSPGDVAGELRDLAPAEGGVLTSFTRVDLAIDDLTGGGYAVLVSSDGTAAACGDISGSGNDVYVAVTSQSDAGYGGIAWLHARDSQTQVSLFISQGLGGGTTTGGNNGNVEPPEVDTPTPATQKTPSAKPTRTPRAQKSPTPKQGTSGEETTYVSPTYGYSMTYDSTWTEVENTTNPTDNGPQDWLKLNNGVSSVYFYSIAADETFPMDRVIEFFQGNLESDNTVSNVSVHVDNDGNEVNSSTDNEAIFALDFTWTAQDGTQYDLYDYRHVYRLPGQGEMVIFLNEGLQKSFDQQAPARQKLEDTITLP
jgi:hypothetical protein